MLQAQRRELGAFLRSRRERLTPADVGLPGLFRRRTPGLRREEVALLAGVGITWYTWLEQGRDISPSLEVLAALAGALKLDPIEQRHLFILAGRQPPEPGSAGPQLVEEAVLRMLASLTAQPAYVLGRRWDVLAWNRAAQILFGDYGKLEGDQRNILHLVFANEKHRRLLVDWDELAPTTLAMFRADCARHVGNPDFERLIAALMHQSPEFREWWPRHDILCRLANRKRIHHPRGGRMVFEYTTFSVTADPDMRLIVYTPLEEDQTAEKFAAMLRGS